MVFFCLVNPISKSENPKCMKNTRAVHIIIQTLFAVNNPTSMLLFVCWFLNFFS